MKEKDYFSGHADIYARFRPGYPDDLYQFIFSHLTEFNCVWDCGTGNGQVASKLATRFRQVMATDISQNQLAQALPIPNILYSIVPAEKNSFPDNQFDLITVAQALHWFNLPSFYEEVNRSGKINSILAVWGYNLCSSSEPIDKIVNGFYQHTVGPYWDDARKLVESEYQTLSFPFDEIPCPTFYHHMKWSLQTLAGYLRSWSATQKYILQNQQDPIPYVEETLSKVWGTEEERVFTFPIFMRMGRIS